MPFDIIPSSDRGYTESHKRLLMLIILTSMDFFEDPATFRQYTTGYLKEQYRNGKTMPPGMTRYTSEATLQYMPDSDTVHNRYDFAPVWFAIIMDRLAPKGPNVSNTDHKVIPHLCQDK